MNDEQKKGNRIIDKKNKPKDPYATSASIGGFIGGIAGYIATKTVITGLGFWQNSSFVGGAAVAGSGVAIGSYYILHYIWERFLKRFYE